MARVRQVAVIIDSIRPYHRKILLGVASYVHEVANWSLYVEDEPLQKLPDLRTWRGDGMLISFADRHVVKTACALGVPLIGIEGWGWTDLAPSVPYFAADNAAVGRLAAEHLIGQGFTRLAYCGVPPGITTGWTVDRAEAFQACAQKAGLSCSIYSGRRGITRKWSDLQHSLTAWLESLDKPVGVMAANDARARHVLEACRTLGVRVPEDVAVLGVDNDEIMCELTTPPLSSIELGARSLGYQAALHLDRLMNGRRVRTVRNLVEPKGIVSRRSTNALAVEDTDVAAAVAYIRDHACDPILIRDVVQAVGISRSTLEPRFKAIMGRTIHSEVQRVQIDRARQLIASSDLPLKQVAIMVGFRHVNYMTTVFREQTGWTPAEYRKQARL